MTPCSNQQSINLTWTRRPCNGSAYLTFRSSDFMRVRKLAMKFIPFSNTEIFVQLSRNQDNQLYLTDVPPEAKSSDLEKVLSSRLEGIVPEKVELKFIPPFETSENEIRELKNIIEENCRKHTNLVNFNIIIPVPKPTATLMKAFINVNDDENIAQAALQLSEVMIGNMHLTSKPVYRSVIKCGVDVCKALRSRFNSVLTKLQLEMEEKFNDKQLFEFEINMLHEDMAAVKMLSNIQEILQILQRTVNRLLNGELVDKSFSNKLNKIFCHGGHMWMRTLGKTNNIHIIEDYVSKTIRLYGSEKDCELAKQRIKQFLEDTENEAVKCIPLSSKNGNRQLLKAIIVEYGANLDEFIESCDLQSAVLDIKACTLSLHGSRDSIEEAETCLRELASGLDACDFSSAFSNEEMCPVCACPALNLSIRLELCGHLYCSECIQGLVLLAQFPIQCCAQDCFQDIILDDICKILGDDPEKIKLLLELSMKHYIKENQNKMFYCPAPDCSMFFYKEENSDKKLNCPLCQNDICIKCNAVFHQGLTCEMYQGSKEDPDYSFKVWQKAAAECKQCPKCNSAIEKTGGCAHMICHTCKAHFCWQCLKEFSTSDEIYRHIPFCNMY